MREIRDYLLAQSPDAAELVGKAMREALGRLREYPEIGHSRLDLASAEYRFFAVYRYLIVYDVTPDSVRVVRVVHASRDASEQLGE